MEERKNLGLRLGAQVNQEVATGHQVEVRERNEAHRGLPRRGAQLSFDVVHLQAYSPRPGTAAARREDDVPLEEKKRRLNHLLALQREIALERNLALCDTEVEVLVEGTTEDARPYGRSRGNRVTRLPEGSASAGGPSDGSPQIHPACPGPGPHSAAAGSPAPAVSVSLTPPVFTSAISTSNHLTSKYLRPGRTAPGRLHTA